MSRRSYKTINLPKEIVEWIDSLVKGKAPDQAPLGIMSRDEFVRVAVALLGASLRGDDDEPPAIEVFRHLVSVLENQARPASDSSGEGEDG